MCLSKTKKWIIGLLILAAVAAAVGYAMAMESRDMSNKGTLVKAMKAEGEMIQEKGELVKEKLKDGSMFLCEKINQAARKL